MVTLVEQRPTLDAACCNAPDFVLAQSDALIDDTKTATDIPSTGVSTQATGPPRTEQQMSPTESPQNAELKARHRVMWALGDYASIAAKVIPDLGQVLIDAVGVRPGDNVLDVACGPGNAAIPAAKLGAHVTACDLTPELLAEARAAADDAGVEITCREGDAEALPFADASFDVVVSSVGVMFAPDHERAAGELLRVCKPSGRIGLANWTPKGFVGEMLSVMKPFAPPPPPGSQPPPLWGDTDHVRALLGDGVDDLVMEARMVEVDCFATPEEFREAFKTQYGPTVAVYRRLGDDPEQERQLDHALDELARRYDRGSTSTVMDWEYLLVTARCQS